jgi:hypothetical protein
MRGEKIITRDREFYKTCSEVHEQEGHSVSLVAAADAAMVALDRYEVMLRYFRQLEHLSTVDDLMDNREGSHR